MGTVRQAVGLIICLALCLLAGGIGSSFNTPSVTVWYPLLAKPSWTPPSWIFAPVWTTLYIMMAVSVWLVWRRFGWLGARVPLALFSIQLILNVAWSGIFFGLRMPGPAFAEIMMLWAIILLTTIKFWPLSRAAAWLLVPYLLWVTYASGLNFSIWRLNA